MSYLRIMDDVNHQCGLDGNFVNPELADWMDLAEKVRDNFASQFHCTITTWGELYGFEKENVKIIINHPLWDTQNPKGILKEAIAEAGDGVTFLDTFNLLRRPGWCYMKLSEEVIP